MTQIKRAYWNKHIHECTKSPDDSWVKTRIEGHDYYGRSLKGKHFEKLKIVVGKIIPLFAISIVFAPISIPVLFAMGKYRKLGISIREVHYDTKIKCLLNSNTVPFPAHADKNLISKILLEPDLADSYEAAQYISLLSQVSKTFAQETIKALVKSGKLLLNDIPGILTKDDAFNYIQSWDDLTHLDLSGLSDLDDKDITFIVDTWPNLKTLVVRCAPILSNHSIDEINKLTKLDKLYLDGLYNVDQFPILHDNLKEFSFKGALQDYPKRSWPNLIKLNLSVHTHLLPPLDQLSELKELSLDLRGLMGNADYSPINQMTQLEKLNLSAVLNSPNCSFDGWTDLKDLSIGGSFASIPPIDHLTKLEALTIESSFLWDLGSSLDQMSSLKKLHLDCPLTDFPNFDAFLHLKELTISLSYNTNLPNLDSLTNLEKLTIFTKDLDYLPPNYLDQLVNLKELTIQGAGGLTVPGDFFNQLINLKYLNLYQVNGFDPLPQTVKVSR